jgi:tRNA threonylcarbamoyladenosine biosynthesis protein TsaE
MRPECSDQSDTEPAEADLIARVQLSSASRTADFAALLAPVLKPGDVLALRGPVGAGKSHLARALIQTRLAAHGLTQDVPSPTFTLVQTYDDPLSEIWHADLYRLQHPDEILELGLSAAFDDAICLIEWPDLLGPDLPDRALGLTLQPSHDPEARILTIHASAGVWSSRLAPVLAALD